MVVVSETFQLTSKSRLGYSVPEVEDFLRRARLEYDSEPIEPTVTARSIRMQAFSMVKGGYSPTMVDSALARLEDIFAERERLTVRKAAGDTTWYAEARAGALEVLGRLSRDRKSKFTRVSILRRGYDVKQVDDFAEYLATFFKDGSPVSPDEVRRVVFRQRYRGYSEAQVDLVLDAAVDVMLAVR